VFDSRK